jgi:hypothetical protein
VRFNLADRCEARSKGLKWVEVRWETSLALACAVEVVQFGEFIRYLPPTICLTLSLHQPAAGYLGWYSAAQQLNKNCKGETAGMASCCSSVNTPTPASLALIKVVLPFLKDGWLMRS